MANEPLYKSGLGHLLLVLGLICGVEFGAGVVLATEGHPHLPKPNTALQIDGLGPCTDNPDRTLHLDSSQPVTVLVHGCYGSAGRFRTLSDVLAFHGQQSACFSYNDRDSLMDSSRELMEAIEVLSSHLDPPQITVMGHSQGGLVARKALIEERENPLESGASLKLVTVSAPLSGIRAARYCAAPLLRVFTLGINDLVCWIISGDKWWEITYASDFIGEPGTLLPEIDAYLQISTDERGTCRKYDASGECVEDDFVFTLQEQKLPAVGAGVSPAVVEVRAGHVEIVGETGATPRKLIDVLQDHGYIRPTAAARHAEFERLLASLYEIE